jgi:hypothetical protein
VRRSAARFSIIVCALFFCATYAAAAEPKDSLDIYVVRGEPAQLDRFHSEIGKGWQGGKFLEPLSSKTEYRYWAFSTRTAGQARIFMFGSMNYGLRLGFETYQQATYYPTERTLLDGIVSQCRLKSNPFFIQPDRTVLLDEQKEKESSAADCIRKELNKANIGMPIKLLGDEGPSERG